MKRSIFILALMISTSIGFAQTEFTIHDNGLMYSEKTMNQLELIVDSLNIKFRACELSKAYKAKMQATAHYIRLTKGKIKSAKADLENGISFEDFVEKYPTATVEKELLVIKYQYTNYRGKETIDFNSMINEHEISFDENLHLYQSPTKGSWIMKYSKKGEYTDEGLRAFYIVRDFQQPTLPDHYARMIQYSDCMVDTSTQIFTENAKRTGVRYDTKEEAHVKNFMTYINTQTNKPSYDDDDSDNYYERYQAWDSLRLEIIDAKLSKKAKFKDLLDKAVKEALEKGGAGDEFEEYVGRYHSKSAELELKRSRIVVGGCSMDNSPRIHAMNIAILSAETVNWEVFLRAHLDIMNDNFSRASDGSYAWGQRNTYIKELEELDINVTDLLLGISLRIENPSENHYYGSIRRVGRALSESKYRQDIEANMIAMIQDDRLDDFNRILIYYLYLNYNHHLKDETLKKNNIEKVKAAIETLPVHLANQLKADSED